MNSEHASDEQLQQYALAGNPAIDTHVNNCPQCQTKAAFYKQLIAAIHVQPLPVMHFDVSGLVLEKLEKPKRSWWIYAMFITALLLIGTGMYLARIQLFGGISTFTIILMAVIALCILAVTVIDQLKTFRHKMNMLTTK